MLSPGTRLGPYEILAELGAGGMGVVYRARDTRLGREVALKVLLGRHAEDPAMAERFEREAQAISALSHPGICTLFDVGEADGTHFLVMELLDGESLAARLARGPLPLAEALALGGAVAAALAAAHGRGIVHRDLKPGNIMLTRRGPKLLDFGLAKLHAASHGLLDAPFRATATAPLTSAGTLVGTLAYMAPEQLEGREADARSDIFALGCVLHEMLTAERPFNGATQASLIAAILHEEPRSLASLQPPVPQALDRLVGACLAKHPEERWQSALDLARELAWLGEGAGADRGAATPRPTARRAVPLAIAVAATALVTAALAAVFLRQPHRPGETTRFSIAPPPGYSFLGLVKLAPDARRAMFVLAAEGGRNVVGVRTFDRLGTRLLPGTEDARGMFWSPDGREIAFFADRRLKRTGADGGPAQTVCDAGGAFSGAWGSQGTILFTAEFGGPILAVAATGGTPRPVTTIDAAGGDVSHFHPAFLPDGRHFVFVARNLDPDKTSVVLASLDSKRVQRLFHADSSALFVEPGYLLFGRDNAMFAWRFDPRALKLEGEPVPAFEDVRYGTEDNLLGASAAGDRLVYLPSPGRRRLVWVDRKGRELGTLGEVGAYEDVRVSPDGGRVAVTRRDPSHGQNQDVWVLDVGRGTGSRITAERTDEFDPSWSPDGERLFYVSDRLGFYDVYERPAGGGGETAVLQTKQDKVLPAVTPDGRHLLVTVEAGGDYSRVLAPLSASGEPVRLSGDSRFSEEHAALSPDGAWTAFDSGESGAREVYVQPVAGGAKRQVSIGGGHMPVWSRSGSELFYAASDGMLMSVPLQLAAGAVRIGEPQPLFLLDLAVSGEIEFPRHPYDVSPDGERFLVVRPAPGSEPDRAIVVTNWAEELKTAR
ncbi:MAG TPA: protein kinase [Thermoanaerobaculaceae bacterium]|nr:protein kinase [Thermoanaerobaculaceae bacterium]